MLQFQSLQRVTRALSMGVAAFAAASGLAHAQQLAFPTAEGFGKFAKGGRGGDVYIVSTLNDDGPGSLRECVEAVGPRTCVFAISGEIQVRSKLHATSPYLTIAGQTAPGEGVQISNRSGPNLDAPLHIDTHDVIVRHLRVRPGPSQQQSSNVDAVLVTGHDIMLDHMSLSWSTDEVLGVSGNGGLAGGAATENTRNITVQWSFLTEPLRRSTHPKNDHAFAAYLGDGVRDITFHHNLIAHAQRRNPNIGAVGQVDYLGNVVYNWQRYAAEIYSRHGSSFINWVGNVTVAGPDTYRQRSRPGLNLFRNAALGEFSIFLGQNLDHNRPTLGGPWRSVLDTKDWQYLATSPVGQGLTVSSAGLSDPQQAYKDVLAFAGATHPTRDAVDARIVNEVRACGGGIIDHPNDRGGWPTLAAGAAPADLDADGIADDWETANGLDPQNPDDRNGDANGDGYTNLETYLNALAGDNAGSRAGQGTGPDAVTTCNLNFVDGPEVAINVFDVHVDAVRPGKKVKITLQATASSCKKSWDRERPYLNDAVWELYPFQDLSLDISCTDEKIEDVANDYIFINTLGVVPQPDVSLSSSATSVAPGEAVNLQWLVGQARDNEAGICEASGLWSGYRSVLGVETVYPDQSGEYRLTCHGPGGSGQAAVSVTVGGAPPPPPPPPANTPPIALAYASATSGDAPLSVDFSADGSVDNDGSIVGYAWDFTDDGSVDAVNVAPTHVYTTPGTFLARLTVTDDGGLSDSTTVVITVSDPAPPPPPPSGFTVGASVVVTVSDRWRGEPGAGVRGDRLPVGTSAVIVDGPATVNGEIWWKIETPNRIGWYLEANLGPA